MSECILHQLARTIGERRRAAAEESYTRRLLDGGPQHCAKKLGEEAAEAIIAAVAQDDAALKAEAADLLYHLLVVLEVRDIAIDEVLEILESRMGRSGLAEKASRAG